MAIDCSVPRHLTVMRSLTGTTETPGSADNPKIMAMRDWIACTYANVDGMMDYCNGYTGDDVAWCGLCAAFCVTAAGIMPPFQKGNDTSCFLWALSWAGDPNYDILDEPVPGAIVVLQREGGGHVTFYESTTSDGNSYMCRGGNQSDAVNLAPQAISNVVALVWPRSVPVPVPGPTPPGPGPKPPEPRRTLQKGDQGEDVANLQAVIGLIDDGDFGGITETQVQAFQAACDNLDTDGVVGPATWEEVDALDARVIAGNEGIASDVARDIVAAADNSSLAEFQWPDRGMSPPGYLAGMALSFAVAYQMLLARDPSAVVMSRPLGDDDTDALAWYESELTEIGVELDSPAGRLRGLFVLMIGLAMRESSGRYCEGRDMSADNVEADTCEAGLFQTSWNISNASELFEDLADEYWQDPTGYLGIFREGISPTANNLDVYGAGEGARYQFLAKFCPLYACLSSGLGLRLLRQHWGPINRHEVDVEGAAEDLLYEVQLLVEAGAGA